MKQDPNEITLSLRIALGYKPTPRERIKHVLCWLRSNAYRKQYALHRERYSQNPDIWRR